MSVGCEASAPTPGSALSLSARCVVIQQHFHLVLRRVASYQKTGSDAGPWELPLATEKDTRRKEQSRPTLVMLACPTTEHGHLICLKLGQTVEHDSEPEIIHKLLPPLIRERHLAAALNVG